MGTQSISVNVSHQWHHSPDGFIIPSLLVLAISLELKVITRYIILIRDSKKYDNILTHVLLYREIECGEA